MRNCGGQKTDYNESQELNTKKNKTKNKQKKKKNFTRQDGSK